jgi:hypothetical protein
MTNHGKWARRIGFGIGVSAVALAAGCAVETGTADKSASAGGTSPATAAAEATRTKAFLEGHYAAAAVRHSFRSAMGDDIDCVDFESEPGVRTMLARGVAREDLLRKPVMPAELAARQGDVRSDAHFNGDADESGRTRACPEGTVGHVRITETMIQEAGGLDAYARAVHEKVAPVAPGAEPPGPNYADYAWITAGWGSVSSQGGTTTMAIASPNVPSSGGDHSLAQIWNTAGSGSGLQTVEVGWNVDHSLYGSSGAPHLFIYSTADGYNNTGCYNNVGSQCLTWVPYSGATIVPGATLPSSVPGGTQHEIKLTVMHTETFCFIGHPCHPSWTGWGIWATVDNGASTYLGMYAQADYGSGALSTGSTGFTFGSEVYDSTGNFNTYPANVPMGESGIMLGIASYGYQAYHRNYSYLNSGFQTVTSGFGTPSPSQSEYVVSTSSAAGDASWTNWYYYGDWQKPLIIFH